MNMYGYGTVDDRKHDALLFDGVVAFLRLVPELSTIFSDCYDDLAKIKHWQDKWSSKADWDLKLRAKANMYLFQASETRYQAFELV